MTNPPRDVDDIASGQGADTPAQTSDEAAEGMIHGRQDTSDAAQPDSGEKVDPPAPKLEDPVSGDPYTDAYAAGPPDTLLGEVDPQVDADGSTAGGRAEGW